MQFRGSFLFDNCEHGGGDYGDSILTIISIEPDDEDPNKAKVRTYTGTSLHLKRRMWFLLMYSQIKSTGMSIRESEDGEAETLATFENESDYFFDERKEVGQAGVGFHYE